MRAGEPSPVRETWKQNVTHPSWSAASDLPEDLRSLVRCNGLPLNETSYNGDCDKLIAEIRLVSEEVARKRQIEEEIRLGKRARDWLARQREYEEEDKLRKIMDQYTYRNEGYAFQFAGLGCVVTFALLSVIIGSLFSGKFDDALRLFAFNVALVLFIYLFWRFTREK